MREKQRQRFMEAVAKAARETPPPVRRGKPMASNLTVEGRAKGLCAMQASPRCRAKRRDGTGCKAPSLRGATRCVKHGGRVEVPSHPHNIKRFVSGVMNREAVEHEGAQSDREFFETLSCSEQREVASLVSGHTLRRCARLYQAARVWSEVKDKGYSAQKQFFDHFARA